MFELITVMFLMAPDGQAVRVEEVKQIQGWTACHNALEALRMDAGAGVGIIADCYETAE